MIDTALESVSVPYKLAIMIIFLMSSVAQLEAEIVTGRGGILKRIINPILFLI